MGALKTAHQHGVVHRDLTPGNVRITEDGRLKVLDFGIAQAVQLGSDETTHSFTSTAFAGTLPYMAPEQVRGGQIDHRTDIYGAGAVLYEMATGSRVFPGLTGTRLLGAVIEDTPIPASLRRRGRSPAGGAGGDRIVPLVTRDPVRGVHPRGRLPRPDR
jgi:eukaryotic-like serine/threonine-protein kinase